MDERVRLFFARLSDGEFVSAAVLCPLDGAYGVRGDALAEEMQRRVGFPLPSLKAMSVGSVRITRTPSQGECDVVACLDGEESWTARFKLRTNGRWALYFGTLEPR